MASSGTFTSGRYGDSSNGPYLTLAWSEVSQSVANNTTTLDLTLRFHWSATINYTFRSRSGSLQGNSYTYSGSVSGSSGSRVLSTQRVTISHNSNGSRSVTLSGNITSLGLNWSGNRVNTMSVSGTANLNTIPRASTLSAFSFNASLKNDTANRINYTIDRKSSGFRHQIQLRDGDTTVRTWNNVDSDSDSTLTLTDEEVNSLLNRMEKTTTKSYTLRVATRNGVNGDWVGNSVSRNATATVHADVKPSVGTVSLSQTGNPVSNHTLQGFSKIEAHFARQGVGGAYIASSSVQVRRRYGGADSQTINSNSGTTSNPVSSNGVYEARGTAIDSRGRVNRTDWATIQVTRYQAPSITNFSAVRNGSTPTTVNLSRVTTHTVLGTSNHLTYTIQRRQGTGAWTNVSSGATGTVTTSGATGSATSTGNAVTQSYEFRLVVTDKLGRSAESLQSVSTQRVVLDIHKNEGVGIGKIREQGVLDVDGSAFFAGDVEIIGSLNARIQDSNLRFFPPENHSVGWARGILFHTNEDNGQGDYYGGVGGYGIGENSYLYTWLGDTYNSDNTIRIYPGDHTPRVGENHILDRGSNENGQWVRFFDGTQICYMPDFYQDLSLGTSQGALYGSGSVQWTYPKSFSSVPAIFGATTEWTRWATGNGRTQSWARFIQWSFDRTRTGAMAVMAVGRWR